MNPESSRGKVGKHQDLEQGDRQRPQRAEKRTTRGRWRERTLQDAIDGFLDSKRSLKEFTLTNYCRQLQNQVTGVITTK